MIFPGQSLTSEPKNAPYENPPEMVEPEEVVMWHLNRLSEPDRLDALLDSLELGLDVVTLTEGILRGAVMNGRHSIDVSLIVAPVVHEFIKNAADAANLDYEEGFPDNTEKRKAIKYKINERKADKMIAEFKKKSGDKPVAPSSVVEKEVTEATEILSKPPSGLMSRKDKTIGAT